MSVNTSCLGALRGIIFVSYATVNGHKIHGDGLEWSCCG